MRRRRGVAKIPPYWFGWTSGSHRLSFYVRVYWECRKRGIRKSDKAQVTTVMNELASRT
jgi:hypothetical protein